MMRNWTLAALAAAMLGPLAPAPVAQEPSTPRPRARTRVDREPFRVFSFSGNRARIGVVVNTHADEDDDRIGARIEAVTPGGPADKSGLKAGDILTRFGGISLGGADADDEGESGPGMKLIELARALDPGDTVRVEYRRGNESGRATIVAEDLDTAFSFTMPRGEFRIDPDVRLPLDNLPDNFRGFAWAFGDAWGRLELVTLNPDLGEYFGTREGVLVVKVPADTADGLALRGGDVILGIGGREPQSPSHAMRILRSYEPGERIAIEIMRKQRRTTVTWTVPERDARFHLMPRQREEPSELKSLNRRLELLQTIRSTREI
ncbi:MAG: PDZ domain-containing protein [Gemmatimonadales bacterium]